MKTTLIRLAPLLLAPPVPNDSGVYLRVARFR